MDKQLCSAALLLCGCFSPNDPLVVSAGSDDSTGDASGDPTTASSTMSTTPGSASEPTDGSDPSTGPSPTSADDSSTGAAVCGNGEIEGDEVCDDGENDGGYGGCTEDCSALGPHCGDGVENGDEACDDGDEVNGNGCNLDCGLSGQELWTDEYDSGLAGVDDSGRGVAVDAQDNVIVVGTRGLSGAEGRAWLRKYDSDGNIEWTQTDNAAAGTGTSWLSGVAIDSNDEIAVAGYFPSERDSSRDGYLAKYSDEGDLLWSDTFSSAGSSNDVANDVTVDYVDRITLTGQYSDDIDVRRYTADGGNGWSDSVDGTAVDHGDGVVANSMGEVIVVGVITQPSSRAWVRKYSENGTEQWTTVLSTDADLGYANGVALAPDGSILVVGRDRTTQGIDTSWLKRVADDGTEDWTTAPSADGVLLERAQGVGVDSQGAIVVVGQSDSGIAFVKLDSSGDELWGREYDLGESGAIQSVAFDSFDNVLVCGYGFDDELWAGTWIGKFSP